MSSKCKSVDFENDGLLRAGFMVCLTNADICVSQMALQKLNELDNQTLTLSAYSPEFSLETNILEVEGLILSPPFPEFLH